MKLACSLTLVASMVPAESERGEAAPKNRTQAPNHMKSKTHKSSAPQNNPNKWWQKSHRSRSRTSCPFLCKPATHPILLPGKHHKKGNYDEFNPAPTSVPTKQNFANLLTPHKKETNNVSSRAWRQYNNTFQNSKFLAISVLEMHNHMQTKKEFTKRQTHKHTQHAHTGLQWRREVEIWSSHWCSCKPCNGSLAPTVHTFLPSDLYGL
jgi:hypothetical protein